MRQRSKLCRDGDGQARIGGLQFVVHDPEDEEILCLVGMTKRGEPLLVNRDDFRCRRRVADWMRAVRIGRGSLRKSLFPRFSNDGIDRTYRTPAEHRIGLAEHASRKRRETDEAGWLIGVPMMVQVVPGRGEAWRV